MTVDILYKQPLGRLRKSDIRRLNAKPPRPRTLRLPTAHSPRPAGSSTKRSSSSSGSDDDDPGESEPSEPAVAGAPASSPRARTRVPLAALGIPERAA